MSELNGLQQYVAATDCLHPKKPGRLHGEHLEQFTKYFGVKVTDFFSPVYYCGELEKGVHYFTGVHEFTKWRTKQKRI